MSACCKFPDNLLVPAVDTVKDANSQPRVLQTSFFKGMVMLHIHKCSQRQGMALEWVIICFEQLLSHLRRQEEHGLF
jgi:hypothetical protein